MIEATITKEVYRDEKSVYFHCKTEDGKIIKTRNTLNLTKYKVGDEVEINEEAVPCPTITQKLS